ncbi:hypothetical protein BSKO_02868 [Bryopsis sp. KO-2023]|nr:hypothetical protein BSKO_02868 [Bryopsis sp. KO-2023]
MVCQSQPPEGFEIRTAVATCIVTVEPSVTLHLITHADIWKMKVHHQSSEFTERQKYKEDDTILAWNLINDPRCDCDIFNPVESQCAPDCADQVQVPTLEFQRNWIAEHINDTKGLGKPLVVEEFGKIATDSPLGRVAERDPFSPRHLRYFCSTKSRIGLWEFAIDKHTKIRVSTEDTTWTDVIVPGSQGPVDELKSKDKVQNCVPDEVRSFDVVLSRPERQWQSIHYCGCSPGSSESRMDSLARKLGENAPPVVARGGGFLPPTPVIAPNQAPQQDAATKITELDEAKIATLRSNTCPR